MDVVLKSIAEVVESSRVYDDSGVDVVTRDDVTLSMIVHKVWQEYTRERENSAL